MTSLRRAAFIDRDGVLNEDLGYVFRHADFHWLPGARDALAQLQQAGFALVVVTNQSGVGRGLYTMADVETLHVQVRADLQARGVQLAGIYACPHHPEAAQPGYRLACACRKPQPGMILQAALEHGLELGASWLFGDKGSDIQAGRRAGVGCCWFIGDTAAGRASGADGASASLIEAVRAMPGAAAVAHTGTRT